MKTFTATITVALLTASTAVAGGHMPAAMNGEGDGKGRKAVAFEVSKSKREPGSTARGEAAQLTEAIRAGKDGGFVKGGE